MKILSDFDFLRQTLHHIKDTNSLNICEITDFKESTKLHKSEIEDLIQPPFKTSNSKLDGKLLLFKYFVRLKVI